MSYRIDVKKLFHDLRGPKGVAALTEEIVRAGNEIEKLKKKFQPQAEARLHEARKHIDHLQKKLKVAQVDLDRELTKTIKQVKKYRDLAEARIVEMAGKPKKRKTKAKSAGTKKRAKRTTKATA